jgi:hypothetical protein
LTNLEVKRKVMAEVAKVFGWSISCAERGELPRRGFYGEQFESKERLKTAGDSIPYGLRGCYFGFKADLKARKESHLFTRYYQCTLLCDLCLAMQPYKKSDPELNYKQFYEDALYTGTFVSHDWHVANDDPPSPWCVVPGYNHVNNFLDLLHNLYLGAGRDIIATTIKDMFTLGLLGPGSLTQTLDALSLEMAVTWFYLLLLVDFVVGDCCCF